VPVRLLREEPERDEAEYVAVALESPHLLRMPIEEPPVLCALPLLPGELRLVADGLVRLRPDHRDVALLDRAIAVDRQPIDRVEVAASRAP